MPQTNHTEEWEKEFDEMFDSFQAGEKIVGWNKEKDEAVIRKPFGSKELKSFISQALQKQREDMVRKVGHWFVNSLDRIPYPDPVTQQNEIISLLEQS